MREEERREPPLDGGGALVGEHLLEVSADGLEEAVPLPEALLRETDGQEIAARGDCQRERPSMRRRAGRAAFFEQIESDLPWRAAERGRELLRGGIAAVVQGEDQGAKGEGVPRVEDVPLSAGA